MSSVDEKCDKIWTFVFKNEYIADEKSEHLLFEMSGNGVDEKCENLSWKVSIFDGKSENLLFDWTVQIGKVSIFFEINVADEKSEHLSSIWCLRLVFLHLLAQLPSSNGILWN